VSRLRRYVWALVIGVALAGSANVGTANGTRVEHARIDVRLVNEDTMRVRERVTYAAESDGVQRRDRRIPFGVVTNVSDVSVSSPDVAVRAVKVVALDDAWHVTWRFPATTTSSTFEVSYAASGEFLRQIEVPAGTYPVFGWNVFCNGWSVPVAESRVRFWVSSEHGLGRDDIRTFSHVAEQRARVLVEDVERSRGHWKAVYRSGAIPAGTSWTVGLAVAPDAVGHVVGVSGSGEIFGIERAPRLIALMVVAMIIVIGGILAVAVREYGHQ